MMVRFFERRSCRALASGMLSLLLAAVAGVNIASPPEEPTTIATSVVKHAALADEQFGGISVSQLRLREGSQIDNVVGRFRRSGETLAFVDEDDRELGGLPNLNLERVLRSLKATDEPENVWWSVSGTVTEFSGRNYLLISRAVYKSAAPPPAPETLNDDADGEASERRE